MGGGTGSSAGSYIPTASVQAEAVTASKTSDTSSNSSNASILSASTQENVNTSTLGLSDDATTKKNLYLGE